ncbi:hypothetical protein NDU88_005903 [Pleurodeles waltl]|uniref:Uncharacterized protein n=1 Tax=Pleurodeles waltl TaxID=8319 RepID=A0AAV7SMZ5_PLEWA|nr:hypothetical protein NDU88_005903 [Pleurodeles waltl]
MRPVQHERRVLHAAPASAPDSQLPAQGQSTDSTVVCTAVRAVRAAPPSQSAHHVITSTSVLLLFCDLHVASLPAIRHSSSEPSPSVNVTLTNC